MSISLNSIDIIATPVVIWSFTTKRFYGFRSFEEVVLPDNTCCEVIHSTHRFYIDIDIDKSEYPDITNDDCITLVNNIISTVGDVIGQINNDSDISLNYAVYSTEHTHKFSYHIIFLNIICDDFNSSMGLYNKLIANCNNPNVKFVDRLYKKNQMFRIPGAGKKVQGPFKLLDEDESADIDLYDNEFYSHWVTYLYEAYDVSIYYYTERRVNILSAINDVNDFETDDIDSEHITLLNPDNNFRFNKAVELNDNSIVYYYFTRIRPSYCDICRRTHTNDNTLIGMLYKSDSVNKLYEYCRRNINDFPNTYSRKLRKIIDNNVNEVTEETDEVFSQYVCNESSFTRPETYISTDESREDFTILKYINNNVFTSSINRTSFYIRAPMKFGKTKALKEFISQLPAGITILVISFRVMFTNEFLAKFNEFKSYKKIVGDIDFTKDKKVIVQLDSIERVNLRRMPNVVILDESESILQHFSADTLKPKISGIYNVFNKVIKYSNLNIIIDANLSDRTLKTIQACSPTHKQVMYHNTNKTADAEYKYTMYVNKCSWFMELINAIHAGKRVVVPTSSIKMGYLVKNVAIYCLSNINATVSEFMTYLINLSNKYDTASLTEIEQTDFDHEKIIFYNSNTTTRIKDLHFSDINSYWNKYNVVIYTPSITSGVSFEGVSFDTVFGIFNNKSCDIYSMIQMLGRARSTVDYHICLIDSYTRRNTDIEDLTWDDIKGNVLTPDIINIIRNKYNVFELNFVTDVIRNRETIIDGILQTAIEEVHRDEIIMTHPYYILLCYNYYMELKKEYFFIPAFIDCLTDSTADISNFTSLTFYKSEFDEGEHTILTSINRNIVCKYEKEVRELIACTKHINLCPREEYFEEEIPRLKYNIFSNFPTLIIQNNIPLSDIDYVRYLTLCAHIENVLITTDTHFIIYNEIFTFDEISTKYEDKVFSKFNPPDKHFYRALCILYIINKCDSHDVAIYNNKLDALTDNELVALVQLIDINNELYTVYASNNVEPGPYTNVLDPLLQHTREINMLNNHPSVIALVDKHMHVILSILLGFVIVDDTELITYYRDYLHSIDEPITYLAQIKNRIKDIQALVRHNNVNPEYYSISDFNKAIANGLINVMATLNIDFTLTKNYTIIPERLFNLAYENNESLIIKLNVPKRGKMHRIISKLLASQLGIFIDSVYKCVVGNEIHNVYVFKHKTPWVFCPKGITEKTTHTILPNFVKDDTYIVNHHVDTLNLLSGVTVLHKPSKKIKTGKYTRYIVKK